MKKAILLFALVALAVAGSAMAQAVVGESEREAVRGVPDRWGLTLGSFWQTFDTRVGLDGHTSTGTEINWEHELGLSKNLTDLQVGFFYRFGDRHRLDVTFTEWARKKTRTLDRDIQWGDTVYNANGTINSKASANLANIIYKYSFFNNGKVNFGLNGGISALWSKFTLSGQGEVAGTPVSGTLVDTKTTIFPIPVIGANFEMTLMKRLFWRAEGNFFAANVAGYDGNVNILSTALDYYFTRNVGLGAGFASTTYRVTKTGSNGGDLFVRYAFSGVFAYLACAF